MIVKEKNIYKYNQRYYLQKTINNKTCHYGSFKTLQEAITYRDNILIPSNWNKKYQVSKKQKKSKEHEKYIRKKSDRYQIHKTIKYKRYIFATFPTLQEAIEYRDNVLIPGNWDLNLRRLKKRGRPAGNGQLQEKYIYKTTSNKYHITKVIDGKQEFFGAFNTLQEAINERNFLEESGWTYDLIDLY